MLTFTLPLSPTLNHAYLTTKSGRRILTDAGRAYVLDAAYRAANAAQLAGWQYVAKTPLKLELRYYFKTSSSDLDNALKLLIDGIAAGLGFNDRHVVEIHGYKAIDKQNPRCEVVLQEA